MVSKAAQTGISGFTLLELTIVVCIISILVVIALGRLLPLRAEAERTAMVQVLGTLRSAMAIQLAARIAGGKVDTIGGMLQQNPMEAWLAEQPGNYLGALSGPPSIKTAEHGGWYYDTGDQTLVYRVRFGDYFRSALPGPKRARFRVTPVFDDQDGNGTYEIDTDLIFGVRLAPLEPFEWLKEPVSE